MSPKEKTRREFIQSAGAMVAGTALVHQGGFVGAAVTGTMPADTAKILNYNAKMGYRRLGKTGIMISEISLGGHGGRSVEDRRPVLQRAIELGMNYVDNNIVEECALYGQAMGSDLRKHFYIGFASWPEKLTSEYEDHLSPDGMLREIDARLRAYKTDRLDLWRPVGATWGEGQTRQATMWEVNEKTLDLVAGVFERAHKQGKVRFLGISAHKPSVFRRVLTKYPQFSVILFPYMFLTKAYDGDSLLALAQEKDVGVIGIKPFAAGATFGGKPTQFNGKVDSRAPALLKAMLQEKRLSAVIPGVEVASQLDENVKASYERHRPLDAKDQQALRECADNLLANLSPRYQWLHDWTVV
ncbi:MAG: aldo/keto reductase [Phycisphaerae bacterium]|nr:aldo/keto reductase [Phycisphaerae bacterium]